MDLHKLKAHSSWDDLRVVLAVARTGSLSAAARELAVNHSTVLRRVAAFETGTGVAMFLRQANAYLLTPAGEEMVAAALRMDDEFNAGLLRILGMDGRPSGTVKVTTVDTIAHHVLPSHLEAFERAHPEISVAIDVSETPCDLGRGEADVAIRCLTSTPSPPDNLVGRPISGIAFAAYGPSGRGGAGDLESYRWVGLDERFRDLPMARWLERNVPQSRIRMRASSVGTLFAAAKAGYGAAVLPCALGDHAVELSRLTGPIPELGGALWLLAHPSLHPQGRVQAFLHFMGKALLGERDRLEGKILQAA